MASVGPAGKFGLRQERLAAKFLHFIQHCLHVFDLSELCLDGPSERSRLSRDPTRDCVPIPRNSCEAHTRLKTDPSFVDIHFHGSTFPHQVQKGTVEFLVNGDFLAEEVVDRERRAQMLRQIFAQDDPDHNSSCREHEAQADSVANDRRVHATLTLL
jgi:hypothetical protein